MTMLLLSRGLGAAKQAETVIRRQRLGGVRSMVKGVRGFYDVGASVKNKDLGFAHSETKSHIR